MAAPASFFSHDSASVASCFGDAPGSSSSHHTSAVDVDDYRILQPGDFKRVKSHMSLRSSLRSMPASRVDHGLDLASSPPATTSSHNNTASASLDASLLPPDFDLVIQSRPKQLIQRQSGDRATFGPWQHDSDGDSDADDELATVPTQLNNNSKSLHRNVDNDSDAESVTTPHDDAQHVPSSTAAPDASSLSPPSVQDPHLHQLKQEAHEVWAAYRSSMTPQHRSLASDRNNDATQPAHIPPRVTSSQRSSLVVLNALPSMGIEQPRGSSATSSNHSHSSSQHTRLPSESFSRLSASVSHGSGTHWRAPLSSDFHSHRPYTASILSSASEHSFLSYQNSFESGMSPLLLDRYVTSSRLPARRAQRPATSGSIPVTPARVSHYTPSAAASTRPATTNELTAEERRQQVRRTKKLTQMLGEEMLFTEPHSSHVRSDLRSRSRPQSVPFGSHPRGVPASAPAFASTAGSKTRALSRKLLHSRSHGAKSLDHAFSDMTQPPTVTPIGLNRKAAAVLGIPHPYSSGALARVSGEEMLASDDELDAMRGMHPRSFIPSGLEEFNEPTPKVAQLATFSAAALDEAASPTLPQDGPFRVFDRSHLDHALVMSESRKLAAARDERRRRVAKMSRWLGEAVPAELILSGSDQRKNAVICSTEARVPSHQSETSHDSAAYTVSEVSHTTSSTGHGSLSQQGSANLQSFISIDSSDDESDDEAEAAPAVDTPMQRSQEELGAVEPSSSSPAAAVRDSISAYRTSIESYEYLLENDHERLTELASIFHGTRVAAPSVAAVVVQTMATVARPPRSPARPRTSPAAAAVFSSLVDAGHGSGARSSTLSSSVGGVPRRSAAFLDLTDSESDSTEADEELLDIDDLSPCYSATLRQRRLDSHDRSISKLSKIFGSTPSQIVRLQSDIAAAAASSTDSVVFKQDYAAAAQSRVGGAKRGDALRHVLKSLEEEALDDSKLNVLQKSEISRKVHLLKKRTSRMFA
ncbi:hypothetical protein EX895_000614 [Sporisorium graminicola]|uniref:Uncharacterized protein n=1 Tax=Sporisorium graminicola TaxID=280036 RepID=A0A4U7L1K0_9BASI|nr:hypothetical protein EX895_000614 [Sporisorium graminicola]TKY90616.1 hypothetical protein EX895_000614 [Sporisorium graminicola]